MYQRRSYGGYHSGGLNIFSILFLLMFIGCIAMMFCGNREPDVVMVQQPQMVMGPNGQPMQVMNQPMYGGGYGYGGDVAGAAATGFVGGMVVGEMLDHGDHGYGYGGGYGGGYGEGGYGGDMGGGDAGFGADQ